MSLRATRPLLLTFRRLFFHLARSFARSLSVSRHIMLNNNNRIGNLQKRTEHKAQVAYRSSFVCCLFRMHKDPPALSITIFTTVPMAWQCACVARLFYAVFDACARVSSHKIPECRYNDDIGASIANEMTSFVFSKIVNNNNSHSQSKIPSTARNRKMRQSPKRKN